MSVMSLAQIERNIALLSRDEQLLLIEKIVNFLKRKDIRKNKTIESQMEEMASDSQIQAELRNINEEFAVTEMDGLRNF